MRRCHAETIIEPAEVIGKKTAAVEQGALQVWKAIEHTAVDHVATDSVVSAGVAHTVRSP
jgi:hypothetical protein